MPPDAGSCELLLHGELNDFLDAKARGRPLLRPTWGHQTAKDLIEAAGVPHTEVDVIVVDGQPAAFERRVHPGSSVAIYPRTTALHGVDDRSLLPPDRVGERFVLDGHLGKLARLLRLLGVDTRHRRDASDAELARLSADEDRTLLTRDIGLLKRSIVRRGRWIRATDPRRQIVEVLRRYPLDPSVVPLSRCLACNGRLAPAEPASVTGDVPPGSRAAFDRYWRCGTCDKVYWAGSHHPHLLRLIEEIRDELDDQPALRAVRGSSAPS